MIPAREALQRLKEGNTRFVAGLSGSDAYVSKMRRAELASGQEPFAIILGCSDSRVPAEIVFDQGLGDLFVIRVAGNIVAPSQVGSVEFAAARFPQPYRPFPQKRSTSTINGIHFRQIQLLFGTRTFLSDSGQRWRFINDR